MLPTIKTNCVYLEVIMNLATIGCILMCMTTSAHAQTCAPPTCFVNGSAEIACNYCPIGFGVVVQDRELMLCRSSPPRNTKCEPCIAGVNFSDTNDSQSKCSGCRICHTGKEVQSKECTVESDRECICKTGLFYYNEGPESCVECTTCGEDEEEIEPCTPTKNRVCGAKSTPAIVTGTSLLHVPTSNQTTPPAIITNTPDTELSKDDGTNRNSLPGWSIALIVCSIILIPCGIIIVVRKCHEGTRIGRDSDGVSSVICNCCIGMQTNKYGTSNETSVQMNGHAQRDNTQYHQVPGIGTNGVVGEQSHAMTSTTQEMEHLQSTADTLGFSPGQLEGLIIKLDEGDPLNRNALKLADQYLERTQDAQSMLANSRTSASEVLKMWVEQRKTRQDLIHALKDMERFDIAEFCEKDLSGS